MPEGTGPFPTVVTRVPYPMDPVLDWQCGELRERGWACVYQHTRGQGRSGGEWEPFVNEASDGQDLLAWVRAQPWSDGTVAWIGDSYLAATGWTVLAADGAAFSAIISRVFAPSLYDTAYEDGLLRHELVTAWMTLMPDTDAGMLAGGRYHRALEHRPRMTMDMVGAGHEVPWFREWLSGEDPSSSIWDRSDAVAFNGVVPRTQVPVMFVGGWSDAFIEPQVKAWAQLPDRSKSLFVIGPWDHLGNSPADIPLDELSSPGGGRLFTQIPLALDWLDAVVRGAELKPELTGVLSYVVGGDRWEHRPDWPPPTVERRLHAGGATGRCDGRLSEAEAGLEAPLTYTYDPEDPLPSHGGAGLLAGVVPLMRGVPPGFLEAGVNCDGREDVLSFVSDPLKQTLHLAGTLKVELEVASDAPDTAFGFRLLERRAKGPEILLREGFATLALREGPPRKPYTPGERVTLVPDGAPLEAELHAGSELVLVLTSSSFPAVEAHPNVAGLLADAAETRSAAQTVYAATLVIPEVVDAP